MTWQALIAPEHCVFVVLDNKLCSLSACNAWLAFALTALHVACVANAAQHAAVARPTAFAGGNIPEAGLAFVAFATLKVVESSRAKRVF